MLNIDQLFKNRIETEKYLRNVYSYLPSEEAAGNSYAGISDEGDIVFSNFRSNDINTGNWSPVSIPYNDYSYLYRGIRSASVFIDRVGDCVECETFKPGSTNTFKSEALALRSWYYFLLMRKFGPVALIKKVLPVDVAAADTKIPRNTYDECVEYIIGGLDQAMAALPDAILNSTEYGKIDRKVVLAMKSRILLYAASPLWNGNTDYSNFKNTDGKSLVNGTYDVKKWALAANVSRELINMMPDGLYKENDAQGNLDPFLSYRNLFFNRFNKEVIWARPNSTVPGSIDWEKHTAPRQENGYNGMAVTQNQVDAYHMANGKQITEAGSGYTENGFSNIDTKYSKAGDWNMYVNREPRFYATVLYNGAIWPFTDNGIHKVELFANGLSGKNGSHDYSATGYLIKKFSSPQTDVRNDRYAAQATIFIRLGEIYLNYAEALNEVDPTNASIAKYVNLVRERGGITNLPAGIGQAEMRERIRTERKIELAFESHRLFDTRRWKIAKQTDGGPMYGMNVSQGNSFTDVSFYKRTVFENRVFENKHYLWPIPQSEMDRNKVMVQNPEW